jgi:hypothetical protein
MKDTYLVFYAGLFYGEFPAPPLPFRMWKTDFPRDLPDGAYIRTPEDTWFRADFTPELLDHVPKELRTFALLLSG